MKISYIHGPGNAFGTFLQWQNKRADPAIIKQTYSGQFYELIAEINGVGQIICVDVTGSTSDKRFKFETIERKRGAGINHYINEFRYASAVGAKISDFSPEVIIVSTDFPSYAFDALPSKPVKILTMHNTFWQPYGRPTGFKGKGLDIARKVSLRATNFAVCVSLECQRQFNKTRPNSSTFSVLQMPRLSQNFQSKNEVLARKLLFVGRIEINKGVVDLIQAFKTVWDEFPDTRLKIVGEGGAVGRCMALTDQLGLSSIIEFTGRLDARGVSDAYAGADLCICPTQWSFNEGLATVPLEAASHGVPTIMSQAVPAKEQFGIGAHLFEPGNIDDLSSAIQFLISNMDAYTNARENARESFLRSMNSIGDWKSGVYSCLKRM